MEASNNASNEIKSNPIEWRIKMARTSTFLNKAKMVSALQNPEEISKFLAAQLVEKGYLKVEAVHKPSRGRPAHTFVLTGKGRGYLALAKNWGKKADNLVHHVAFAEDTVDSPSDMVETVMNITESPVDMVQPAFM